MRALLHACNLLATAVAANNQAHIREHQQKITLRQIRRRCVLTQATLNLRPLRPVRPELRPLSPLRPVLPELRPLRPVHPDSSLNTIAHHDLPPRDAHLRGTPEYFLA